MGLIQAFKGTVSLTSEEQGKEFIYCDVFDKNTLVRKGIKSVTPIYNNRYTDDNIIKPESRLIVDKEQALLVVEDGKIIDFSAEAGVYTFKSDSEPSLFEGELKGLSSSFNKIGKHFSYGERIDNDKYAYYVNLKEITDNKFGMGNVPFRDAQLGFTVQLKGFGVYSYKIEDPLLFFANVAVDMKDRYVVGDLDEQLKEEFQRAIKVATGNLSFSGISYESIPEYTKELARSMDKILDEEWKKSRGLTVVSVSFISVKPDETSIKKIMQFQQHGCKNNTDITDNAVENPEGPMNIFAEMECEEKDDKADAFGFVNPAVNADKTSTDKFVKQGHISVCASAVWTCACGMVNNGNFCPECGSKRPSQCRHTRARAEDTYCPDCGIKLK